MYENISPSLAVLFLSIYLSIHFLKNIFILLCVLFYCYINFYHLFNNLIFFYTYYKTFFSFYLKIQISICLFLLIFLNCQFKEFYFILLEQNLIKTAGGIKLIIKLLWYLLASFFHIIYVLYILHNLHKYIMCMFHFLNKISINRCFQYYSA